MPTCAVRPLVMPRRPIMVVGFTRGSEREGARLLCLAQSGHRARAEHARHALANLELWV